MARNPDTPPVREDGLQLEESRAFQRSFWAAQRVAWIIFLLLVCLALAGLTGGGGPLSRRVLSLAGGELDYPLVARWEASDQLAVTFGQTAAPHRLTLGRSFGESFAIESIQPPPARSLLAANGETLEFTADPPSSGRAVLHLRPLRPGFARYEIAVDGRSAQLFTVVLP